MSSNRDAWVAMMTRRARLLNLWAAIMAWVLVLTVAIMLLIGLVIWVT